VGYRDRPHVGVNGFVNKKQLKVLDDKWKLTSGMPLERLRKVWQLVDELAGAELEKSWKR